MGIVLRARGAPVLLRAVFSSDVSGIWYLVYCTSPIAYPIVNGYSPSGTWGPRTSTGGLVIVLRARVPPYLYGESVRGRSRHYGNLCVDSALRTCFSHGVVNGSRSVRRRVELGRAHRREVRSPPTCRSFDLVVARLTHTLRGPSFTRSQRVSGVKLPSPSLTSETFRHFV